MKVKKLLRYWFIEHNPFYLFSVLLMFWALNLADTTALPSGEGTYTQVIIFFALQNIYEIAIVLMAVYLLKHHIQPEQGLVLIFFSCLFMGDVTMYQMRLAGCSGDHGSAWSYMVTAGYFALAVWKVLYILKGLEIKLRGECLFSILGGLMFIYCAPHLLDFIVSTMVTQKSFGWWEIYLIWLAAAAIHIPVIVRNWNEHELSSMDQGAYLNDNTLIYRILMIVPVLVIPFQLIYNTHSDMRVINPGLNDMMYAAVPYVVIVSFYLESLFHDHITCMFGLRSYNFWTLMVAMMSAFITGERLEGFFETSANPLMINLGIIFGMHLLLAISRKNELSAGILVLAAIYLSSGMWKYLFHKIFLYIGLVYDFMTDLFKRLYFVLMNLSRTSFAAIVAMMSFMMLGIGFFFSLKSLHPEED